MAFDGGKSMRISAVVMLVALLQAAPAMAQDQPSLAEYHVLLVPVFFFGPGGHGSQWETNVGIASTAGAAVSMPVPLLTRFDFCSDPSGAIVPYQTRSICPGYASPSGLLLYVPKTLDLKELHVNTRVRDISRVASSAGTQIPVVREGDFHSEDFLLLDIPNDARFRSNLRIYGGLMSFSPELRFIHPGGAVGIDIYDSRSLLNPLVSTAVELSAPQTIEGSPYLVRPGYFSFGDLVAAFPALANVPSYTIRIAPYQSLTSPVTESSVWAFVTVTNNDTQEVTIVAP
jgi:hypothetical protein